MWCEFIGRKCLGQECKQYKQGEYCPWERGGVEALIDGLPDGDAAELAGEIIKGLPPLSELIKALEK